MATTTTFPWASCPIRTPEMQAEAVAAERLLLTSGNVLAVESDVPAFGPVIFSMEGGRLMMAWA